MAARARRRTNQTNSPSAKDTPATWLLKPKSSLVQLIQIDFRLGAPAAGARRPASRLVRDHAESETGHGRRAGTAARPVRLAGARPQRSITVASGKLGQSIAPVERIGRRRQLSGPSPRPRRFDPASRCIACARFLTLLVVRSDCVSGRRPSSCQSRSPAESRGSSRACSGSTADRRKSRRRNACGTGHDVCASRTGQPAQ